MSTVSVEANNQQSRALEHDRAAATSHVRNETARVRQIYDSVASRYDAIIALSEKVFFGDGRSWICSQAHGDVLEIAIGTGRNLPYYPMGIRLTGIELSRKMIELARHRAQQQGREVDLCLGDAQALAFPDESFDTVVFCLALGTIPDDHGAIAEASRVLRPGGRLLLLEHVRSPVLAVRVAQRALEQLFVRIQGDHLLREPLDQLTAAGFTIERLERSKWGIVERLSARKPA